MYALHVATQPTVEPLTIEEMRQHLELYDPDGRHDGLLAALIQAAREHAETETRRRLLTTTLRLSLSEFPDAREPLWLPAPPLQSVTHVKYYVDGVLTTWSSANYVVGSEHQPGFVQPVLTSSWPSADDRPDAAQVTYVAGWTSSQLVPAAIRTAMKLIVARWFENRSEVVPSQAQRWAEIPAGAQRLLANQAVGDEYLVYG